MGITSRRTTARAAGTATTLTAAALAASLLTAPAAQASPFASSANPLDHLGRPTPETQAQVRDFANQPWVPPHIRDAVLTGLAFSAGINGDGGPELPADGPRFTQFHWPTVSGSCIGGELDAVGTAIAVPGPADIPVPSPGPGQTAFVFTALGTAPAAAEQGGMHVQWFNLSTLRHGSTPLGNHGINPDGPATLSGAADTGNGTVVAVISGAVHTEESTCSFLPTAAIIDAR